MSLQIFAELTMFDSERNNGGVPFAGTPQFVKSFRSYQMPQVLTR